MIWFIHSFIAIFVITCIFTVISVIGWGVSADYPPNSPTTIKVWKRMFLFGLLGVVLLLLSSIFLRQVNYYKFASTDVVSVTIIDKDGKASTSYKWKNYILPNSIVNYLTTDTITMVETTNPWNNKFDVTLTFMIGKETPVKEKPKPISSSPVENVNKIEK